MIARNVLLVLLIIGAGIIGLILFLVAYFSGLFEDPQAQAYLLFDEVDLRLSRPWENARQKEQRQKKFGALIEPGRGEWGRPK